MLDVPGPAVMDEKTAEQKGAEFTQQATDHGYRVDCGLRDPLGNQIRILQPKAWQGWQRVPKHPAVFRPDARVWRRTRSTPTEMPMGPSVE